MLPATKATRGSQAVLSVLKTFSPGGMAAQHTIPRPSQSVALPSPPTQQAAQDAHTAAQQGLQAAQTRLQEWRDAKAEAAARAAALAAEEAAEEGGEAAAATPAGEDAAVGGGAAAGLEGDGEEVELSREEEMAIEAEAHAKDAEAREQEAARKLQEAEATMQEPFVCYQSYWVSGLGMGVEAVYGLAEAGVAPRAVVWAKALPSTETQEGAVGNAATGTPPAPEPSSAVVAGAAGVADASAAPEEEQVPELFLAVRAATQAAGWDDKFALTVALETQLPPSPPGEQQAVAAGAVSWFWGTGAAQCYMAMLGGCCPASAVLSQTGAILTLTPFHNHCSCGCWRCCP